jgi:hypothetical protein
MRVHLLPSRLIWLVPVTLFAACGQGESTGAVFPNDAGVTSDGTSNTSSNGGSYGGSEDSGYTSSGGQDASQGTSSGATGDSGGTCVSSCTTDLDCQNSCPPVAGGGTSCCDVGGAFCYTTAETTCEALDAGSD